MVAIQRMVRRKRKEEMQNSSEGGHQEKINPKKKQNWNKEIHIHIQIQIRMKIKIQI